MDLVKTGRERKIYSVQYNIQCSGTKKEGVCREW